MATIDFPSGPSVNQQYTFGARTWVWDGAGWERLINQGQVGSAFVAVGPVVDVPLAFPGFAMSTGIGGMGWTLLNYV